MNVKHTTPLKIAILDLLRQHHFLAVPQMVDLLHQKKLNVNKTSVYRTIQTFMAEGLLCQQTFEGELVYELQADHHDHLYCTHCGQVQKAECQVHVNQPIAGFTVQHHHLTLYGVCANCAQTIH